MGSSKKKSVSTAYEHAEKWIVGQCLSPHTIRELDRLITEADSRFKMSRGELALLRKRISPQNLHEWKIESDHPRFKKSLFSSSSPIHPLALATAAWPKAIACYQAALYCLGFTQLPTQVIVGKFRTSPSGSNVPALPPQETIDVEFSNEARTTSQRATFDSREIFFVERGFTDPSHIEVKHVDGLQFHCTSMYKTVIDLTIAPHYGGGIRSVMEALSAVKNNIEAPKLITHYTAENLNYPYWQRLGWLLDHVGAHKISGAISKFFGTPKRRFYAERPYEKEWNYSEKWHLYTPRDF